MKKTMLLLAMLVAMTANAVAGETDLWSGDKSYVDWAAAGGNIEIGAAQLQAAQTGDKIGFDFTLITEGEWAAVQIWVSGNYEAGADNPTAPLEIELTDDLLAKVQANGFLVGATNIHFTRVYLITNGSANKTNKIPLWQGEKTYNNWAADGGNIELSASQFQTVVVGDLLVFDYNYLDSEEYAAIQLWVNGSCVSNSETPAMPLTLEITETLLGVLKTYGTLIGATNVTFKEIYLLTDGSDEPMEEVETVLYEGETVYAAWTASPERIVIDAAKVASAVAGDVLAFEYTVTDPSAYAAIQVWKADETYAITNDQNPTVKPLRVILNDEAAQTISKEGFFVGATNVTITKLSLLQKKTTDIQTIDNPHDQLLIGNCKSKKGVYDLQGSKVADSYQLSIGNCQLKKGIYIQNGKKYILK